MPGIYHLTEWTPNIVYYSEGQRQTEILTFAEAH